MSGLSTIAQRYIHSISGSHTRIIPTESKRPLNRPKNISRENNSYVACSLNLPLTVSILPVECDKCNHAQRQPGYCEDQRTERLTTTQISGRLHHHIQTRMGQQTIYHETGFLQVQQSNDVSSIILSVNVNVHQIAHNFSNVNIVLPFTYLIRMM